MPLTLQYPVLLVHVPEVSTSEQLVARMIFAGDFLGCEPNGIRHDFGGNYYYAIVIGKHQVSGRDQHTATVHTHVAINYNPPPPRIDGLDARCENRKSQLFNFLDISHQAINY